MNLDALRSLVARFWEAEAASRSPDRAERMRVMSWEGDLYRIEEQVRRVMSDPEWGDLFVLAAAESPDRPAEDWVVAALGGGVIEDEIDGGDTGLLHRLVTKGLDPSLAARIGEFID